MQPPKYRLNSIISFDKTLYLVEYISISNIGFKELGGRQQFTVSLHQLEKLLLKKRAKIESY